MTIATVWRTKSPSCVTTYLRTDRPNFWGPGIFKLDQITPNEMDWLAARAATVSRLFSERVGLPILDDPPGRRLIEALVEAVNVQATR